MVESVVKRWLPDTHVLNILIAYSRGTRCNTVAQHMSRYPTNSRTAINSPHPHVDLPYIYQQHAEASKDKDVWNAGAP